MMTSLRHLWDFCICYLLCIDWLFDWLVDWLIALSWIFLYTHVNYMNNPTDVICRCLQWPKNSFPPWHLLQHSGIVRDPLAPRMRGSKMGELGVQYWIIGVQYLNNRWLLCPIKEANTFFAREAFWSYRVVKGTICLLCPGGGWCRQPSQNWQNILSAFLITSTTVWCRRMLEKKYGLCPL